MKRHWAIALILTGALAVAGCSVFGDPGVEIAPYDTLVSDGALEIRHYEELVLVSSPMDSDEHSDDSAFRKLFRYISGDNSKGEEIAMTAPVFLDRASVEQRMFFVLPSTYSLGNAPNPSDSNVELHRITDVMYAVITFNGRLRAENIDVHKQKLIDWLNGRSDFEVSGSHITAGYNPPWTLPMMRRNEVLLPVVPRQVTMDS